MQNVPIDLSDAFPPELTRDTFRSYLVISLPEGADFLTYQAELLKQNPYPGIMPFTVHKSDQQINLHYQLDARLAFSQYLQKEETGSEQIMKILVDIAAILLESKNLLLYPTAFLLKPEYIFLEPQQNIVSLIYVPVKAQAQVMQLVDINANFQRLIRSLFRYREDLPPILATIVQEESFQIKDFRVRLEESKFSVRKEEAGSGVKEKPFQLAGTKEETVNTAARPAAKTVKILTDSVVNSAANSVTSFTANSAAGLAPKFASSKVIKPVKKIWPCLSGMKIFGLFLVFQLVLAVLLVQLFPQVDAAMEDSINRLGMLLIIVPLNVVFLRALTRIK